MRSNRRSLVAVPVIFGALLFAGCRSSANNATQAAGNNESKGQLQSQSQSLIPPAETAISVPAGSEIRVRLVDSIGSARNRSGDTFGASLDAPIEVNAEVVIPQGANVTGRIVSARPSGHLKTPPQLAVTLTSIEAGGKTYEIATSDRRWAGKSHKKRNAEWIGGGAGAGALIGALIGHGKGAAIGAGIGAGGGTATAYATGKKDILLPSETRLNFVLRRPLTITKTS